MHESSLSHRLHDKGLRLLLLLHGLFTVMLVWNPGAEAFTVSENYK